MSGTAILEINNKEYTLTAEDGIEIPALAVHLIANQTQEELIFLVISLPNDRNDRINY